MVTPQQAAVGDTSIAGLPADVFAELAQEALNASPDSAAAALEALSLLAESTHTAGWGWTDLQVRAAAAFDTIPELAMTVDAAVLLIVVVALSGVLIWLRMHAHRTRAPRRKGGHHDTPHRLAYAEAVTAAAQMLATGSETPLSIARATGLARDIVAVVGSRRLIPAAGVGSSTGVVAGAEASSGRKQRGTRATAQGRVLK